MHHAPEWMEFNREKRTERHLFYRIIYSLDHDSVRDTTTPRPRLGEAGEIDYRMMRYFIFVVLLAAVLVSQGCEHPSDNPPNTPPTTTDTSRLILTLSGADTLLVPPGQVTTFS